MFRARTPQGSLLRDEFLVPDAKLKRIEKSWAEAFQARALPLIDEERFAGMYHAELGRPNRAVQTLLGVLILKEMFDLTDEDALDELEFNLLWHHALRLTADEAHLAQKTVHNFRVRLMSYDGGRIAFEETTERILQALGVSVKKQRLDSTHIMSNIARLTRLGLFCETIRVFLRALSKEHPELAQLAQLVPEGLRRRYMKEGGEPASYEDARSADSRRRLPVCARDLYRLVDRFKGTDAKEMEAYGLMKRVLHEQCHVGRHKHGRPEDDDDDAGEGKVPIALKDPKHVPADSLQSPHDPEVTYSGHKGQGYEVQIAETCGEDDSVRVITHVEVTPSSGSDANFTLPLLETLAERSIQPEELWADTTYGSGHNSFEAERQGTELISPVGGPSPVATAEPPEASKFTSADFEIDVTGGQATVCPAGHEAIAEYEDEERPERVEIYFASASCTPCPLRERCPVKLRWPELAPGRTRKAFILRTDLVQTNIAQRRRAQTEDEWRRRYGLRAGIEATNSELKRAHGLGKLRVRGGQRVRLAVYMKALACNFKRMIAAIQAQDAPETPAGAPLMALAA